MSGVAAIAFLAAFTSCSKSTDLYDQGAVDEKNKQEQEQKLQDNLNQVNAKYAAAFEKAFGKVGSNVDWGFGTSSVGTRGEGEPYADTGGEHWARFDPGYKEKYNFAVPAPLTAAQKDKVRRYFQTHQSPGGTECEEMSDYFIQHVYTGKSNIEGSNSAEEYMTSNGNLERGSAHMDRYVAGSAHYHVNNFNATNATGINVWDGVTYQDGYVLQNDGNSVEDYNHHKNHTDHIMFMRNTDTDSFGWYNSNSSLEINDHYRLVSGDVIQAWDNSMTGTINGETSNADVSGMMFVGFDYEGNPSAAVRTWTDNGGGYWYWGGDANKAIYREATASDPAETKAYLPNKTNGKEYVNIGADGYYSDWIVRIIKAVKKEPVTPTYRVIAEDLNADEASDFDFNDVVFDVEPNAAGDAAKIVLRAAGGIYKLTVGGNEVHEAFGKYAENGSYPMINTSPWNPDVKAILFEAYPGNFSSDADIRNTIKNIVIKVYKPGFEDNGIELYAKTGEPACKILVDQTFGVVTERTGIADKNTNFHKYVQGTWDTETNGFWWKAN